jgi:2-polyprenyl-3-methyl-5-hydroxy-6-metoxy-1,4-benzoquinol methylase
MSARVTLFNSKKLWVIPFVTDKKVLDLGCVQHSIDRLENSDWLHRLIKDHAKSILGVDYLKEEVSKLNEMGYSVVCADVEDMQLNERFEVIVAGDIIEHLANPGAFLRNVSNHLEQYGTLLVSTPNPFTLLRFVELLFKGRVSANPEHTCWFTEPVLNQLAIRYGLEIKKTVYINDGLQYYPKRSLWFPFLILQSVLVKIRPQLAETLGFEIQKLK